MTYIFRYLVEVKEENHVEEEEYPGQHETYCQSDPTPCKWCTVALTWSLYYLSCSSDRVKVAARDNYDGYATNFILNISVTRILFWHKNVIFVYGINGKIAVSFP